MIQITEEATGDNYQQKKSQSINKYGQTPAFLGK
jgi:hypothetical protein